MCQMRKYKKYKYTNTAYDEVPEIPNMWYIFEKRIVQGYQKLYSHVSNAQIQKIKIHKYTNTANTANDEVPEDPTCNIFLKRGFFKDIKDDIPTLYATSCMSPSYMG